MSGGECVMLGVCLGECEGMWTDDHVRLLDICGHVHLTELCDY